MAMTREEKVRQRLFPNVQTIRRDRGFVPLPIILRRAQFLFSPRHWQVYCYVLMKAGPGGIAWFTMSEIAFDLNFHSTAKLKPYIDQLIEDGWLCHESSQGRDYYIAPDPIVVLRVLHAKKTFSADRLEAIDELLDLLKQSARLAIDKADESENPELKQDAEDADS